MMSMSLTAVEGDIMSKYIPGNHKHLTRAPYVCSECDKGHARRTIPHKYRVNGSRAYLVYTSDRLCFYMFYKELA